MELLILMGTLLMGSLFGLVANSASNDDDEAPEPLGAGASDEMPYAASSNMLLMLDGERAEGGSGAALLSGDSEAGAKGPDGDAGPGEFDGDDAVDGIEGQEREVWGLGGDDSAEDQPGAGDPRTSVADDEHALGDAVEPGREDDDPLAEAEAGPEDAEPIGPQGTAGDAAEDTAKGQASNPGEAAEFSDQRPDGPGATATIHDFQPGKDQLALEYSGPVAPKVVAEAAEGDDWLVQFDNGDRVVLIGVAQPVAGALVFHPAGA